MSTNDGLDVERLYAAMDIVWPKHTEGSGGTGTAAWGDYWTVNDPAVPSKEMADAIAEEYRRLAAPEDDELDVEPEPEVYVARRTRRRLVAQDDS